MDSAQRKVFDEVVAGPRGMFIGPLRAAIHRPELADVWQRFGAILRYQTSLPPRLTELAIIVTARRWNSQLEWQIHAEAAKRAGLDPVIIEAIRQAESPAFQSREEADVYEFARELQMTGQVSDAVYAAVKERWNTVGVVELTTVIGYYTLVSMTLNAHELPALEGAPLPFAMPGDGASLTALPPAKLNVEARV
jgi:4-carboxymuconolactone decarboxylase